MTFTSAQLVHLTRDALDVRGDTMSVDQALGFTVNQYLFARGMTRGDLGKLLGVAGSNVSNRLRGKSRWTAADLATVAEVFGVEVADLFPVRAADGSWVPAPYVPGQQKSPAPAGTGLRAATASVAGTGFEPATSGL